MTPLKKEHWQIQLFLPYNALEKKGTMKGKKKNTLLNVLRERI